MHVSILRSTMFFCVLWIAVPAGCRPESPRSTTSPGERLLDGPSEGVGVVQDESGTKAPDGREVAKTGNEVDESPSGTPLSESSSPRPQEDVDPVEAWEAACKEVEELKRYRPLFIKPTPLDELLAWVPEGKKVQIYDEKCRPVRVERHEDKLMGLVDVRTTLSRGVKRVHAMTARFGQEVYYTGPGFSEYEKNKKGEWEEVGAGGSGCLETRSGALNRVTEDSAFYSGAQVSLNVVCDSFKEWKEICKGGGERTCRTCRSLDVRAHSHTSGFGFGYMRASSSVSADASAQKDPAAGDGVDCSKPCPADSLSETMEKMNRFLKGKRFVTLDSHENGFPALFRSRKVCRRHRRKRKN